MNHRTGLLIVPVAPFPSDMKIREDIPNSSCTAAVLDTGGKFTAGIVDTVALSL